MRTLGLLLLCQVATSIKVKRFKIGKGCGITSAILTVRRKPTDVLDTPVPCTEVAYEEYRPEDANDVAGLLRDPKVAKWEGWSDWSDCPVTCGPSTRSRSRDCKGGQPGGYGCIGLDTMTKDCSRDACPSKLAIILLFHYSVIQILACRRWQLDAVESVDALLCQLPGGKSVTVEVVQ